MLENKRRRNASPVTARGFDHHRKNAGLVAGDEKGNVAIDADFRLKQLLAGRVHIRGIGESYIASESLLNRDARSGIAQRTQVMGIDFDGTGPEKPLYAAADGGIERTAQERVRGGVR